MKTDKFIVILCFLILIRHKNKVKDASPGGEKWGELRTRNEKEVLDKLQSRLTKFCDEVQAELPACPFITDDIIVKIGNPVDEILLEIEDKIYDMVVMGDHGQSALANALMGSTSRRVVRRCNKPVLVVRLPEDDEV